MYLNLFEMMTLLFEGIFLHALLISAFIPINYYLLKKKFIDPFSNKDVNTMFVFYNYVIVVIWMSLLYIYYFHNRLMSAVMISPLRVIFSVIYQYFYHTAYTIIVLFITQYKKDYKRFKGLVKLILLPPVFGILFSVLFYFAISIYSLMTL